MKNKFPTITKIVLGTVALIFTPALWEYIGRPILSFLSDLIVKISAFFFESYRKSIYIDAAKGFYEQASVTMLTFLISIFLALIAALLVREIKRYIPKRPREMSNNTQTEARKKTTRIIFSVLACFYLIFSGITFILEITRISYVNKLISNFHINLESTAPFLSEAEEEQIRSDYARIEDGEGYREIIDELQAVQEANDVHPPQSLKIIL